MRELPGIMRRVDPHALWLGHAGDARNSRALFDAGIQALVQLAMEEPAVQAPRELLYCRIPLVDGGGNHAASLTVAINTVRSLLRLRTPTLVCCSGGMSRAPAVTAAALALAEGADPDQCLQRIVTGHPHDVSLTLWREITGLLPTIAPAVERSR